ncbi:uncharacterized protein ACHE_30390A [Aspergillus chevalieri]|uniref:CT20 family protein n=1 Tax=Aspergillus chevalieri TaxID=182096 RepID=A0A7R7ZLF4_ASPCH|nr:uncharacterized protein ACHE_30390A [Aspergillus chevalieri]BCR86403.1 hypothetical protein ACHE_30390A [Aspergillus chevalieri]
MPPKKKPKLAEASETENGQSSATPASGESAKLETDYDIVADPWTDEQETALLKAIIKWKPVGMHKHFRMIAISEFLKTQGYAPANADHTRIPGIWRKLSTLYNLAALDEREDSLISDVADDGDPSAERYCPFQLPDDEYGDMMFERRLATEDSASPTSGRAESRRGSTVADTDEARSSPAPSRGRKSTRGRPPGTRGTRAKRFQAEESRKSAATVDDEEDSEEEEADEDASDAAKEDSEIEDDEEEAGDSPNPRSTRAQTSRSKRGGGTGTRRTGRRR